MIRLIFGGTMALLIFALLPGTAVLKAQGADLDPQSLVGEWWGTWVDSSSRAANGKFYLTITKVEGTTCEGKFEATGTRGKVDVNFKNGTVASNRITIANPNRQTELTVAETSMTGSSVGPFGKWDLSLMKHK